MIPVRTSIWLWAAAGLVLGLALFGVMPRSWLFLDPPPAPAADAPKEVWACPMLCVKLDHPGTCPVCGMDLERLEDTGDEVTLTEHDRRVIDLQTTPVARRPLAHELRFPGELTFDERRVTRITAWVPGRITRLFADTQWTDVRQGDHLFEIYSPTLLAAQAEYLATTRGARAEAGQGVQRSARDKLLLMGLLDGQIDALEAAGRPSDRVTIYAPTGGTIVEVRPRQGDQVAEGTPLYTIADFDVLWLLLDVTERELPWIAVGQPVELELEAWPGRTFHGAVEFIFGAVDPQTRTTRVRVALDNHARLLKPGMWGDATLRAQLGADGAALPPPGGGWTCPMHPEVRREAPGECPLCAMPLLDRPVAGGAPAPALLAVPATAVLRTGERSLVYVMTRPPRSEDRGGSVVEVEPASFAAREVRTGPRAGEWVPVLAGVEEGERVVTRGAFLIDSQMELLGKASLLHPEGGAGGDAPTAGHGGH